MRYASLFAGIGGFDRAFGSSDESVLMCEIDDACQGLIGRRFPGVPVHSDVTTLESLPRVDVVVSGFPCQDISPAGTTQGFSGPNSSLFRHVVRLIERSRIKPSWVVLENVPFIRHLDSGKALEEIVRCFDALRYRWAYRIVDAQAFGLPQRRKRWIFVASKTEDPREVLFADEAVPSPGEMPRAYGFYWTEGNRGLGLAADAIPPLKVGSSFGIPASPAIWDRASRSIVTPSIEDAERLQGFPINWTSGALKSQRWRMVGNAISVPLARWIVKRVKEPGSLTYAEQFPLSKSWPPAAWGDASGHYGMTISDWPVAYKRTPIMSFLIREPQLLSRRASAGFLSRARASSLRMPPGFLDDVEFHVGTFDI